MAVFLPSFSAQSSWSSAIFTWANRNRPSSWMYSCELLLVFRSLRKTVAPATGAEFAVHHGARHHPLAQILRLGTAGPSQANPAGCGPWEPVRPPERQKPPRPANRAIESSLFLLFLFQQTLRRPRAGRRPPAPTPAVQRRPPRTPFHTRRRRPRRLLPLRPIQCLDSFSHSGQLGMAASSLSKAFHIVG